MTKNYETALIIRQEEIADDIYSVWLKSDKIAKNARPGQFVGVFPTDGSMILPRPISICEIDTIDGSLRLVYRTAGKGTSELATFHTGSMVRMIGPLGNGYDIELARGKKALVIGGGIGIPPMLELAKELENVSAKTDAVMGFRDELFLMEEFRNVAETHIATDTGKFGTKGTVIDAIVDDNVEADIIFACGPMPMLKAIKSYSELHGIPAYISLEERMACGIGACLGCVVKTNHEDHHSHVNNARICTEGPVFNAEEVAI